MQFDIDPKMAIAFLCNRGMTQAEIAQRAGCNRSTIWRVAQGKSEPGVMLRTSLARLVAAQKARESKSRAAKRRKRLRREAV